MKCSILFIFTFIALTLAQIDPIKKSCSRIEDCMKGLECTNNKCSCPFGTRYSSTIFEKDEEKAKCVDVLNSSCDSNDDCSNLEDAVCSERKCICEAGTVPGKIPPQCLHAANINEYCEFDSQCAIRVEESKCINKKCNCEENFHAFDGKCFQVSKLGEECNGFETRCYLEKNNKNVLECQESKCICTLESEDDCKNNATSVIVSMATMVFFVFGILKVW